MFKKINEIFSFNKHNRKRFKILRKLMSKQWLLERQESLEALLYESDDEQEHALIFDLLIRFNYITYNELGEGLKKMANIIINELDLTEEQTQICAITFDDEADSSQKFLDLIKIPLARQGWTSVKTVNAFRNIYKNYKNGRTNIVFIDEFIGSGRTIRTRIKQIKNDIKDEFSLKIVFFAGMKYTIDALRGDGEDIRCVFPLGRGISDSYTESEAIKSKEIMRTMESRLKQEIGSCHLLDYSLGFGGAESLYSLEGCHGNTPNSVFPILWWPRSVNNKVRKKLLHRFERGLS